MGPFWLDRGGLIAEEVLAAEAAVPITALRIEDPKGRPPTRRAIAVACDERLRPLAKLGTNPRPERLRQPSDLGHAVLHRTFGCLQPADSIPVAMTLALTHAPLVVAAAQPVDNLGLEQLLDHLAHRKLRERRGLLALFQRVHQLLDPLARPLGCR